MAHDPETVEAVARIMNTFIKGHPDWGWAALIHPTEEVLEALTSRGWRPPEKKDADGWIEWGGGECPVAGHALVLVKLRSGDDFLEPSMARTWWWGRLDEPMKGDIIAYRVVEKTDASQ